MMIDIEEAKRDLSRLIDLACAGVEVIIARDSEPSVKLVPIARPTGKRVFGSMRGKIAISPEFFEPFDEGS